MDRQQQEEDGQLELLHLPNFVSLSEIPGLTSSLLVFGFQTRMKCCGLPLPRLIQAALLLASVFHFAYYLVSTLKYLQDNGSSPIIPTRVTVSFWLWWLIGTLFSVVAPPFSYFFATRYLTKFRLEEQILPLFHTPQHLKQAKRRLTFIGSLILILYLFLVGSVIAVQIEGAPGVSNVAGWQVLVTAVVIYASWSMALLFGALYVFCVLFIAARYRVENFILEVNRGHWHVDTSQPPTVELLKHRAISSDETSLHNPIDDDSYSGPLSRRLDNDIHPHTLISAGESVSAYQLKVHQTIHSLVSHWRVYVIATSVYYLIELGNLLFWLYTGGVTYLKQTVPQDTATGILVLASGVTFIFSLFQLLMWSCVSSLNDGQQALKAALITQRISTPVKRAALLQQIDTYPVAFTFLGITISSVALVRLVGTIAAAFLPYLVQLAL